jgi:hypothetical protein
VHPQREDYWGNVNPIGQRSCYDEGKRCAETLFFDYHRQHRLEIKVARIFNTYGPRMHPNEGRVVHGIGPEAFPAQNLGMCRELAAEGAKIQQTQGELDAGGILKFSLCHRLEKDLHQGFSIV